MYYKVDKARAVTIFNDGESVPFIYQPRYPNGEKFENGAAAKRWAELFIAAIEDPNKPYAPNGKGLEGEPRPPRPE